MGKDVHIKKDARAVFSKAATVFIMYLTTTAHDMCRENKRLTVNAADVLRALEELEVCVVSGCALL